MIRLEVKSCQWPCSFLMQGFVEGIAGLAWQSGIFLELWGRVVVNPRSRFVNLWERSTAFAATFASACLNGEITLKLFMMRWKSVLTSRCSISTGDYGRTACRRLTSESTDSEHTCGHGGRPNLCRSSLSSEDGQLQMPDVAEVSGASVGFLSATWIWVTLNVCLHWLCK